MFAIVYYAQYNGKLPLSIDLWITAIALGGTLIGQVQLLPKRPPRDGPYVMMPTPFQLRNQVSPHCTPKILVRLPTAPLPAYNY